MLGEHNLLAGLPTDPASGHDAPDLALATAEVIQLEAFHLDLLAFATLLPGSDLLLGTVPVDYNADVVGFANLGAVLLVHGAAVALEAGVAEADDVTGADLVVLGYGGVRQVGVHQGTVASGSDGKEGIGQRIEQVLDQPVRGTVANGRVLDRVDGFRDLGCELDVGLLKLVLTRLQGWGLMALLNGSIAGVLGVELDCNDCLGVIKEQDIDILGDCCLATPLGGSRLFNLKE